MSHSEFVTPHVLDANGFPATQLTTRYIPIVRSLWIGLVSITLVLFIAGLFVTFGQLHHVCVTAECHPLQLTPQQLEWNHQLGLSLSFYAWYITLTMTIFGIICFVVGSIIFWHQSDNWMALYVSLFLILFAAGALPVFGSLEPMLPQVRWWHTLIWFIGSSSLPVVLFIFPDGRFVPSPARWLLLSWILYNVILLITEPLPPAGIFTGPPSLFTQFVFVMGGLSQIYRYRRTDNPILKQQTKWAVFGFIGHQVSLIAIVTMLSVVPSLQEPGVEQFFFDIYAFAFIGLLPILFIPLSLAFCILRYHLWDIDIVINRTLVYTVLTAVVFGLYTAIVGGLSVLFHNDNNPLMSLLATGVVAVSFHTIRDYIQRMVNRLMFGHRDEPYMVLERLSQQLEPVVAVDEVLPTITQSIGEALQLPYVAIALLQDGQYNVAASYPERNEQQRDNQVIRLALEHQSNHIGQLWLTPRDGTRTFSAAERDLLSTIARQTSIAAYNVRLTEELQRSREALVTTLEDERRRMRRDIHDGLGPILASVSLGLDAIRNLAEHDSQTTTTIATELKEQVQFSLSEVRRIAYNLRPPALDELGLVGALREHFNTLDQVSHPNITFTTSARKLTLPAAVEVAAYRIVLEAITNVQRHAHATHCHVDLTLRATDLRIRIEDDGIGISDNFRAGVGIMSMQERAEELGGHCTISHANVGMQVEATLPI